MYVTNPFFMLELTYHSLQDTGNLCSPVPSTYQEVLSMRTLKYAILGLINREPMSGYDITREFNNNDLANFWYAKHSQVYPELARLMEEGLVTCEIVIQGEKLEKKIYSITEAGKQQLQEWLMKDEPLEATPKDVFRLRMYFSDFMTPEQLKTHLSNQLQKHILKKKYLDEIMLTNHNNTAPAVGTKEFGDFMVLEGAIMREQSYIDWIEDCQKRCTASANS